MFEAQKRPRRSDEIYYEGMGLGYEDDSGGSVALLVGLGFVVVLALLSFPFLDAIIVDTGVRWGFLVTVLALCALALLWAVYPKRGYRPMPPLYKETEEEPGAAEREMGMISNALDGSPFSQLHAYLELREMLVRRYMLLHHLPRVEAEAELGNGRTAFRELGDEDLVWLLRFDFKRAYEPSLLETPEGQGLVADFNSRFPELLRKLEVLG